MLLAVGVAQATPSLSVTPNSIATDEVGTVQIAAGSVAGSQVILRLYVDANGNGVINAPADVVIWTDVVIDNVADWSPNMFSDTNVAGGAVRVDVSHFTPLGFPYPAGNFIWQAEDSADASTATAAFTISQAGQTQSVSGTVRDSVSSLGIPGAMVVALPYCEEGEEAPLYSAISDGSGAYTIQIPAEVECRNRVILSIKPGFMSPFTDQPNMVFNGTSQFTNQDPILTLGAWAVTGQVQYSTGPQMGGGIPGAMIFAGFNDDPPTIALAFTDENGNYSFLLDDGPWEIEAPEDGIDHRGAVFVEGFEEFDVTGAPVAVPALTLPAANAFFEGILLDENGIPVPGRLVATNRIGACDPECYNNFSYSRADGSFTLGVVGPTSPATFDYGLEVDIPLKGLVSEQLDCETISAGDTLTGRDLHHFAPTSFVTGTMLDEDGQPLAGMCLFAQSFPGCTNYSSTAISDCDGNYSLPVLDGEWFVEAEIEDVAALYGGFSPSGTSNSVTVTGADVAGHDLVLGPSRFDPHITRLQPDQVVAGSQMIISGYGFSFGSTPQVFFEAVPATVVVFRADLGTLIVEVPVSLAAGSHTVTVVNTDSGVTSDPACLEIGAGPYTPVCMITGTVTDSGGAVANAVVNAEFDGSFVRSAVTDINGDYSIGLDAVDDFDLTIHPPAGTTKIDASYVTFCGDFQDHFFVDGWQLSGQIVDDTFDAEPVAEMPIFTEEQSGTGYTTFGFTDPDGFFTLNVPSGTYVGLSLSTADTRFIRKVLFQNSVSSNIDFGSIVAITGSVFTGTVVDAAGNGVGAALQVKRRDNETTAAFAITDTCTGDFNFVAPVGEYSINLVDVAAAGLKSSKVEWVTVGSSDQAAEFDFVMLDAASSRPATSVPGIRFVDPSSSGQEGQPIFLASVNVAGTTVDVLFSNGVGGFVNGTSTVVDVDRGYVVTRVPAGSANGEMKLRVDGVDSETVPFTLLPGMFSSGGLTVSGTVSGAGGAGVLIAVTGIDPAVDCEDGVLLDYGVTDGSGNYGPLSHLGGDIEVSFIPPVSSTLTTKGEPRSGVVANLTVDTTLQAGIAVSARALDEAMNPLKNAVIFFEHDASGVEDEVLTDANGDGTVYVPAGNNFFSLMPPHESRLIGEQANQAIGGPLSFGDVDMSIGVVIGSALLRTSDGSPVTNAFVEANESEEPFQIFFERSLGADGGFQGPLPPFTQYNVQLEIDDDTLSDTFFFGQSGSDEFDTILYPAFRAEPAGIVTGLVRDDVSLLPLADIGVGDGAGGAFTRTCSDGNYRLKLPVGDHLINFSDFEFSAHASEWFQDAYCFDDATPRTVTEGGTTTADGDLALAGTVSGIVLDGINPLFNATVCASSVALGDCTISCSQNTGFDGLYTLTLPPGTDYVVMASSFLGSECYDSDQFCASPTPVTVVVSTDTPNIDFNLGCTMTDVDGDGVTECAGDCDDSDPNNFPFNAETCDGQDNNCDGLVDDDDFLVTGLFTWYEDLDVDGAGDPSSTAMACATPMGFVGNNGDCDPMDGTIFPGATEIPEDGIDQDCNGVDAITCFVDNDLDGFGSMATTIALDGVCDTGQAESTLSTDCNDADGSIHPGAGEIAADGIDQDCDTMEVCYQDLDGDTYGTGSTVVSTNLACTDAGESLNTMDCNDGDGTINPAATELPTDGVDQDCDTMELCYEDADGDTYGTSSTVASTDLVCTDAGESINTTDCNDGDATINPAGTEIADDGIDQDCDGADTITCFVDADQDGFGSMATTMAADGTCDTGQSESSVSTDCNDGDNGINPGATDIVDDGIDQDCSGTDTITCFIDNDQDGFGTMVTTLAFDGSCDTAQAESTLSTDCDDTDAGINPSATEIPGDGIDQNCDGVDTAVCFVDSDGDGFGTSMTVVSGDSDCNDPGESNSDQDCDDTNVAIFPGATEIVDDGIDQDCNGADTITCFVDADQDGFGSMATTTAADGVCDTGQSESTVSTDCNDGDAAINPAATEVCDGGVDNDCDGLPDDADPGIVGQATWYADVDADGFGNPGVTQLACSVPSGFLADNTDCNDVDPSINPSAIEIADDGIDQDCSGSDTITCFVDTDQDGFGTTMTTLAADGSCDTGQSESTVSTDCNDGDAAINPSGTEIVDDGIDQDCSGTDTITCFVDTDQDGFGTTMTTLAADGNCDTGQSESTVSTDCNDGDVAINPSATEIVDDGIDQDCNGSDSITCFVDGDQDGFGSMATTTAADGVCDTGQSESTDSTDCNDGNAAINPAASEIVADGVDQDCDSIELCYVDGDGDTYGISSTVGSANLSCVDAGEATNNTDCNDGNVAINPGATEGVADGVDQDCDAQELCYLDADSDTYGIVTTTVSADLVCTDAGESTNTTDCNDGDGSVNPGATEGVADGVDQDCDSIELCYQDLDGDTFGSSTTIDSADLLCNTGSEADDSMDCDDTDAAINPGAMEIPGNGIDEDCDTFDGITCFVDGDGDGEGSMMTLLSFDNDCLDAGESSNDLDCDDTNAAINTSATEIVDDGIDQDCNGADTITCFVDADQDNFGSTATTTAVDGSCDTADSESTVSTDCDDAAAGVNPGATEIIDDGIDQDCSGADSITCFVDADQDGFGTTATSIAIDGSCDTGQSESTNNTDCDDAAAGVNPAATEINDDGIDQDCNGADSITCFVDSDMDAFGSMITTTATDGSCDLGDQESTNSADCNDTNAGINPMAAEIVDDGIDQDCSGADTITCFVDTDMDGFGVTATTLATDGSCDAAQSESSVSTDCNDGDLAINPGAVEVCSDTIDNNCNGLVDTDDLVPCGGPVMMCSTLGDQPQGQDIDDDIFTITGAQNEQIDLSVDVLAAGAGRVTLLIIDTVVGQETLFEVDSSQLPNNLSVQLPGAGTYRIGVIEQSSSQIGSGPIYTGAYCLTVDSDAGAASTLTPAGATEGVMVETPTRQAEGTPATRLRGNRQRTDRLGRPGTQRQSR